MPTHPSELNAAARRQKGRFGDRAFGDRNAPTRRLEAAPAHLAAHAPKPPKAS